MTQDLSKNKTYKLEYNGIGADYFGILIVNRLLTAVTLGFYHPWAKAKELQYLYQETTLNDEPFTFHGTGKEMFMGFIKAVGIFGLLLAVFGIFVYLKMPFAAIIIFYFSLIAIFPFAIHGTYKYRMSRTSWRGIRFGYRGDLKIFAMNFFKWIGLTIVTIGIYSPWFSINIRKYLLSNIRFGSANFNYKGDGAEYFVIFIKGYFLTIITLGIYSFWWQKDIFDYYINNISLHKGDEKMQFESTVTGGGIFELTVVNMFILIFTLGLGFAWAQTRTMKYLLSNIKLSGNLDLDDITQTEANYKDASGEDISDMLDMDFVM